MWSPRACLGGRPSEWRRWPPGFGVQAIWGPGSFDFPALSSVMCSHLYSCRSHLCSRWEKGGGGGQKGQTLLDAPPSNSVSPSVARGGSRDHTQPGRWKKGEWLHAPSHTCLRDLPEACSVALQVGT